ncbi:MAG: DNA methyltransferase [Herpetosiphonaceae bacterium]|nr:DNA methyltransferase [Herpetosiphonaceae bacterium]
MLEQPPLVAPRRGINGESNKLHPEDRAAHDWYRFVLSYPPHLVRDYVRKFGLSSEQVVLDPFSGTGTTVVECKKLGIPSVGIEATPMAHFAGNVKIDWTPDPAGLVEHSRIVANAARAQLRRDGIEEGRVVAEDAGDCGLAPLLRELPPETAKILLTHSISPLPLHKTLVLLDCLEQCRDARYYNHQRLALAHALISSISNLRFGPEVGVGPAKDDAPVIEAWLADVERIAHDLERLQQLDDTPAEIRLADARQIVNLLAPQSVDAVITSPPYPNEKDYTRTTRLEAVLLGFITNKAELQALKRTLVRSNTRSVYKNDDDDQWVADHAEIQRIAEEIEAKRIRLGKTSGFERMYARVTKLYFGGMMRHLADLRTVLRPGAQLAYVVGDQASYLQIMIRTGELLADLATSLGYEVVSIDLFRTRLATATKQQLREEVVVLRWTGEAKDPPFRMIS